MSSIIQPRAIRNSKRKLPADEVEEYETASSDVLSAFEEDDDGYLDPHMDTADALYRLFAKVCSLMLIFFC